MNIILIYPEMPDTFWTMKHLLKIIGKKAGYPPLGLLTVAALLPENWNKRLADLNIESIDEDKVKWADFIFIGGMNVQKKSAAEIISYCKNAGKPIVAGGPLFTHEYESFPEVDYFVLNEAEITLPMFLNDLSEGNPKKIYKTDKFADIKLTPLPLWELAKLEAYEYAVVQYSRGCPYMCDFCDVTALFGRVPRTKTSQQILDEIKGLGDLSRFSMILFADDNLIGNKPALTNELLPALINWRDKVKPKLFVRKSLSLNTIAKKE